MAKIADMQIPLYDDNELHILDVASALIKRILGKYSLILKASTIEQTTDVFS